jgi:hypothetical protein
MKRWLKYILFGGHYMGLIFQLVVFGFFSFLLKIYENYMKIWLKYMSYLVATICVLASPYVLK